MCKETPMRHQSDCQRWAGRPEDASLAGDCARETLGCQVTETFRNKARFDGNLRIYPTLRCNLACAYCVNEQVGRTVKNYPPVDPDRWARALAREQKHVVFTGGEPFLYPGLVQVINSVDPKLKVRVYTNLCLPLEMQLAAIRRPVHFYVSWHPQKAADRERFLANVQALTANPLFSCDIHAIDAEENRAQSLREDLDFFLSRNLRLDIDADQRTFAGSCAGTLRNALCAKRIYLIGPDGARYQCVSRLMRADRPMENMLKGPLGPDMAAGLCPDFGNCAPCDQLGETVMHVLEERP